MSFLGRLFGRKSTAAAVEKEIPSGMEVIYVEGPNVYDPQGQEYRKGPPVKKLVTH